MQLANYLAVWFSHSGTMNSSKIMVSTHINSGLTFGDIPFTNNKLKFKNHAKQALPLAKHLTDLNGNPNKHVFGTTNLFLIFKIAKS